MDQFDLNPEMKKLYEAKQKQRAAAKAYYQNLVCNPYRPLNEGAIFDSGTFRFNAMSAYHLDYFKPTPRSYFALFGVMTPMFLYFFYLRRYRKEKEKLLRSGVIKYEDRDFKSYF